MSVVLQEVWGRGFYLLSQVIMNTISSNYSEECKLSEGTLRRSSHEQRSDKAEVEGGGVGEDRGGADRGGRVGGEVTRQLIDSEGDLRRTAIVRLSAQQAAL